MSKHLICSKALYSKESEKCLTCRINKVDSLFPLFNFVYLSMIYSWVWCSDTIHLEKNYPKHLEFLPLGSTLRKNEILIK